VNGLTLDTGALIAVERGSARMTALLRRVVADGMSLSVPAGVVAQAWRDGSRQARLARLLSASETEVVAMDHATARAIGAICGQAGVDDVVDVSVVLCARERRDTIVTSDQRDLRRIDAEVRLIVL
jgi:hypothetical protein